MTLKILTIAILVICSAVYADIEVTDEEIEQVKADIEHQIVESGITCENVVDKCQELGKKTGPIKVCLTLLQPYLCNNLQSLDDVKKSTITVYSIIKALKDGNKLE